MRNKPLDELEQLLDYLLTKHEIKLVDIIEKLDISRYDLDNIRRSTKQSRKTELMNRIISSYAEHFPDGKFTSTKNHLTDAQGYPDRLIAALERENVELRELLKENNKLMQEILKKL